MQNEPPPPRMPVIPGRVVAKSTVRLSVVPGGVPFTKADHERWGLRIRRAIAARNDPPPSLPPGRRAA